MAESRIKEINQVSYEGKIDGPCDDFVVRIMTLHARSATSPDGEICRLGVLPTPEN